MLASALIFLVLPVSIGFSCARDAALTAFLSSVYYSVSTHFLFVLISMNYVLFLEMALFLLAFGLGSLAPREHQS